ncbi:DUF5130 family protein [Actinomycetes bacterium M1A6_2h]
MASGDLVKQNVSEENLPVGHVLTSSGRISAVHQIGTLNSQELPFSTAELLQLDQTLEEATRATRLRFNVYVGDLGSETAAGADALFPTTPDANTSVLVAVSPNERAIEVRSGRNAHVSDRVAQLGITAATASFRDGNLIDGLVAAVRVMSAAIIAP